MEKEDLGLQLVSFSQNNPDMTFLQIFSVHSNGMSLSENYENFTLKDNYNLEIEIPPKSIVTKVFKVDLKKKIYVDDCKKNISF
jgi:hypothetical protein